MAFDPANRGSAAGPSYNFRQTSTGQGNWNTGGALTGTGSFERGISPVGQPDTNRMGQLISRRTAVPIPVPKPLMAAPPEIPPAPAYPQPGTVTDVFGPSVRLDPGVIAQMLKSLNQQVQPASAPPSNFPARPGVSPMAPGLNRMPLRDNRYGNDQYGRTFSGGPRNSGGGSSGGGFGGGGGGGF